MNPNRRKQYQCNNGFWDKPAEERAARMDAACERAGVRDFFDLSAEDRARAYDDEDEKGAQ